MNNGNTNIIAKSDAVIAENSFSAIMKVLSELTKFRITMLVSFTTGLGYILAAEHISIALFFPILGIFLLACASSCLNHYQERDTDALMERTKYRPIPSGRIEPVNVLFVSLFLLIAGTVVLLTATNFLTFLVGIFTFVWYNGIYTPLKKVSAFAIIPGSLVGALPPVAGWVAAGGYLFDSSGPQVHVTLPNSKVRVVIPTVKYNLAVKQGFPHHSLIPEIRISPTVEDMVKGNDRVLQYAIDSITSHRMLQTRPAIR